MHRRREASESDKRQRRHVQVPAIRLKPKHAQCKPRILVSGTAISDPSFSDFIAAYPANGIAKTKIAISGTEKAMISLNTDHKIMGTPSPRSKLILDMQTGIFGQHR
jgi:hypothetical protein